MIKIIHFVTPPRIEQETILNYDYQNKEWRVYTDIAKHASKLEPLLNPNRPITKGYNNNILTLVDGYIDNSKGYIPFTKKHEFSKEERQEMAVRFMKNIHKSSKEGG